MRMPTYENYKESFKGISMPFAFVDMDMLDQNITSILSATDYKKIRIATKSIRSIPIIKRILAADERFQGLMCYTIQEARFLYNHGLRNILIGYPTWDRQAIESLLEAEEACRHITFMIDSIAHVKHLQNIALHMKRTIKICLDIDMSVSYPGLHFGVRRSPLHSWEDVSPVIDEIMKANSIQLVGIMGYEAQIAGVTDHVKGRFLKNQLIQRLKKDSIVKIANRRAHIVSQIKQLGIELQFVNAGGTGSIDSSKLEDVVTEITVGSAFFSPALFDYYRNFKYLPAAGYAIEVVRIPSPNIVTCLGGGYMASGAIDKEKLPTPYLPEGLKLTTLEGAGEVQTPIIVNNNKFLSLGDPVFFRHAKAGELCERFSSLYALSGTKIVDCYPTYRGEGECFL